MATARSRREVLYVIPILGGTPRVVAEDTSSTPTFSPDGHLMAFTRDRENVERGLFIANAADGSDEHEVFNVPDAHKLIEPKWSPDGKTVAFTGPVGDDEQDKRDEKDKDAKSDVQVITRAVYRSNGNPTYVDATRHTHIFTIAATRDAAVEQLR